MPTYVSPSKQLMVELYVRNLQASKDFYRRVGFTVVRAEGTFMVLQWEGVLFALKERPGASPPLPYPVGTLRIMVPNVDTYWRLAQDLDVPVLWPIANQEYGLRDFAIAGPDRLGLCFATRLTDVQEGAQS